MYRIILVDDEAAILQQLCSAIDWGSLGFEISGAFEHAQDALSAAESLSPPDALLTDIRLGPDAGYELASGIRKLLPSLEVIFLSAYDDFIYAKHGIDLGIFDYLLKPVSADELKSCIARLKLKLDKIRSGGRSGADSVDSEFLTYARRQFWGDVLWGVAQDPAQFPESVSWLGIPADIGKKYAAILCVGIDYQQLLRQFEDPEKLLSEVCGETFGPGEAYIANIGKNLVTLFLFTDLAVSDVEGKTREFETALSGRIEGVGFNAELHLGKDIFEVSENYRRVYSLDFSRANAARMIKTDLNSAEPQRAAEMLRLYCGLNQMSAAEMRTLLTEIAAELADDGFFSRDDFEGFRRAVSIISIPKLLLDEAEKLFYSVSAQRASSDRGHYAIEAKKYINSNLGEYLSLEAVAAYLSLSPVYLSKYFKQHTGEGFIDYLNGVRVLRAKELLADPAVKIGDIPSLIGYNSRTQFYNIFIQRTGCSPSDFRKLFARKQPDHIN